MQFIRFILALVPIIWLMVALSVLKLPGFLACIITVIITAFESICIWHFSSANMLTAALEGALNAIWPICRRRMSCCQFYAYSVWVCRRSHRDHFRNHRTCPGGDRGEHSQDRSTHFCSDRRTDPGGVTHQAVTCICQDSEDQCQDLCDDHVCSGHSQNYELFRNDIGYGRIPCCSDGVLLSFYPSSDRNARRFRYGKRYFDLRPFRTYAGADGKSDRSRPILAGRSQYLRSRHRQNDLSPGDRDRCSQRRAERFGEQAHGQRNEILHSVCCDRRRALLLSSVIIRKNVVNSFCP